MTDDEQLRSLVDHLADAWNRGDGDAYGEVFAEDADFTSIRLDRGHGRAEIAAGHRWIFSSFYRHTRLRAEIDRIRYLRPDIAIVNIDQRIYHADGTPATGLGGNPGHTTHILAVAERQPAGWRIVALQNMVPAGLTNT